VLAFWGAPDDMSDHAAAACDAALSIMTAVEGFNDSRRDHGLPTCSLRIGVHTGSVLVGNVGFEGRLNYTIIGDVANMAQRLEQAGHMFLEDRDAVTLASDKTLEAAGPSYLFESIDGAVHGVLENSMSARVLVELSDQLGDKVEERANLGRHGGGAVMVDVKREGLI
jgi:adenylate cyclase